jgi:hypothetical protein
MPRSEELPRTSRNEKLTFARRRSGYYFKEPETGIERVFRREGAWDPTPQKVRTWLSMCQSKDVKTRHEGLFALRRSRAVAPRVVDLASEALRSEARSRAQRDAVPALTRGRRQRRPRVGLLPALTGALDPSDDLSGSEIVRTLRELGDRGAVAPLRDLLSRLLSFADEAPLAQLPRERAQYALTVIDALLALGARQERELLLEFLEHRDDVIRSLALSILHDRAGPWSRPALRGILQSDRPFHRRMTAAEALFTLGDGAAQRFIEATARSPVPEERRRAVPVLALRHEPADLDLLEQIWRREPLLPERMELGLVLLERGRLTYARVFREPLAHPYPHMRLKAVRLLHASRSPEARALLLGAMADEPDPFIRSEMGRVPPRDGQDADARA